MVVDQGKLAMVSSAWRSYLQSLEEEQGEGGGGILSGFRGRDPLKQQNDFTWSIQTLTSHGLEQLVATHFLHSLEKTFKDVCLPRFWKHFEHLEQRRADTNTGSASRRRKLYAWVESALTSALTELCAAKSAQERRLRELCAVMQHASSRKDSGDSERLPGRSGLFLGITVPSLSPLKIDSAWLLSTYHRTTCALILTTIPAHFSEVLRLHFRARLWEFSQAVRRRVLGLAQGGGGRGSAVGGKEKGVQENEEGGAYKILRTGLAAMDTDMLGPHSDMLEKAGDHRDGVDGSGNTQGSPDESFLHQRGFDKALHRRQKVERAQMMQGSGERGKGAGEGGGDEEECDDDGEAMGRRKVRKRGEESESVGEEGEEGEEGEDDDDDEEEEGDDMEGMDYVLGSRGVGVGLGASEAAEVAGTSWVADVRRVATQLRDLGLMTMSEEAYANVIYSQLRGKILRLGKEQFERPVLPLIRHWIEAVPLRFLCVLLPSSSLFPSYANSKLASPGSAVTTPGPNPFPSPLASPAITAPGGDEAATVAVVRWRLRLEFYTYEILGDLRISELFDIIKDYPESLPAVEDLRQCLANTGHHARLVETFRSALRQRLLTAGAATTDILEHYVATIKSLRAMDPSGVVLEAVGEPIEEYLRGRQDTIRCIVTMLTDDSEVGASGGGDSLFEELGRSATMLEAEDSEFDPEQGDGEEAWTAAMRWDPDPVEADPSKTSRSRRMMDIISTLVGIYGSKELFVNEYRLMLADKLLAKSDYDTDRDIKTLELLKLRFGETNLHNCEVMLKDLADSKRINANIKSSPAALRNSIAAAQSASLFCASMLNMSGGQDSLLRGPASSIPSMLASLLPSTSTSAAGSSSGSSAQITTRTQRQGSAAGQLPNLPSGQAALSSGTMAATIAGLAANQNLGAHLDPNTRLALLRARMHALRTAASAAALEGPLAFGVGGGGAGGGLPWAGDKDDDDMLTVDMIDATIVSALFWPPFQGESIKLPEAVQGLLDAYAARYHALKAPRKLQWKTQLGTVKLELEFEDRTVQFTVSPVHAVLVMHFEKTNRWLSSDLAEAVGVPVGAVRKKMSFWVNQGVVTEAQAQTGGEITYTVVETLGESGGKAGTACGAAEGAVMLEEEEGESAVASIEDQRQHELEVYESYVIGMLTNFESLPLDRIHSMLKMFMLEPPYDKTMHQLQAFLGRLVAEQKLELRDGLYRRHT